MAVFLDANIFLDLLGRKSIDDDTFIKTYGNNLLVSALSIHILFYAFKFKIPSPQMSELLEAFNTLDLTKAILDKALTGPTSDFEDNIQLHSAISSKCTIFLTRDKDLLSLGYFGDMCITKPDL